MKHAIVSFERILPEALIVTPTIPALPKQDEAPDLQQELQDLVTKTWVEDGLDVVVTSRPSGIVDASQYVDKFVIMNLLPLASEQQRRIIQVQMKNNEFFDTLFATRWELELHTECMTN